MNVVFLPPAEKYLKKLKDRQLKEKYRAKICQICEDPMIGEQKTGDLAGIRCCDIYHARVNYELAYYVAHREGDMVVVVMAGTRENFYDVLKTYWKKQGKRDAAG